MSAGSRPASGASSLQSPASELPNRGVSETHHSPPFPSSDGFRGVYSAHHALDPRSSSSVSLRPSTSTGAETRRRTLLMIYIHGYMGSDASFHSFPAHVHGLLKQALVDTHVVHTKIYPRYKTYKVMDVARDNFSSWLEPHESPMTDVILLGHSMGGLLAAEAVLMPGVAPSHFRHRILGTISLDSPFLGLHPGIISTGIASLFRPDPGPPEQNASPSLSPSSPDPPGSISPEASIFSQASREDLVSSPDPSMVWPGPPDSSPSGPDPNFNPPFFNDTVFRDRGRLRNLLHFAKKYSSQNLAYAARDHVMSHLEYGVCLLDYAGMNVRYDRLRQLEEVTPAAAAPRPRVHFANYYTVTTGRPKTTEAAEPQPNEFDDKAAESATDAAADATATTTATATAPTISVEDSDEDGSDLRFVEPKPMSEEEVEGEMKQQTKDEGEREGERKGEQEGISSSQAPPNAESAEPDVVDPLHELQLPDVPDLPDPPQPLEVDPEADGPARKEAEKGARRRQKAYDEAVKQRDKIIKKRQKLVEKHEKQVQKEADKRDKQVLKEMQKEARQKEMEEKKKNKEMEKEKKKGDSNDKKLKDRKFCMLPRDVSAGRDGTWIPVRMDGLDEVAAHCALFLPGAHYDAFVGDVASRAVAWVREDDAPARESSLESPA